MLAHAPMEPPAAVAEFQRRQGRDVGGDAEPAGRAGDCGEALGIKKEDVTCHVTLLGGGFGRKSKPDYVAEAALLSKQVGKPVKIVWSREDDLQFDYFHSPAAHVSEGGDWTGPSDGAAAADGVSAHRLPGMRKSSTGGWQPDQGWTEIPYRLANLRVENAPAAAHTRVGWLRSVANIHHAYAVQTFTDELAALAQADRVDYLLKLIGAPRVIDFAGRHARPEPDDPDFPSTRRASAT